MTFILFLTALSLYYIFLYYWMIKPYQLELKKKNAQMAIINRVSLEFHKSYALAETIPAVLEQLMKVSDADGASLFIYKPETKKYVLEYAAGRVSHKIIGFSIDEGEGIVSKAVKENRSLVVDDVTTENSFCRKADELSGYETKNLICVPLIIEGNPVGAFELLNKKDNKAFDYEDLQVLEILSNVTAITVRNTLLLKKI